MPRRTSRTDPVLTSPQLTSPQLTSPQLTSDALRRGLTRHQLAAKRVDHPIHGVVTPAGSIDELANRCRAIAVGLPDQHAFSHFTAASLLQLPLPPFVDVSKIHVSVPATRIVPDHEALVCHGIWLPAEHVCEVLGVRCVNAARCYLDLAAFLRYDQLVALGDHAVRNGLTTIAQLTSLVTLATRRRGVVAARRALRLIDPRAESPPESVTRVWLIEAGLPEVTPQAVICDHQGRFVARVDLAMLKHKVVIEYQGSYHRDPAVFAADIERRRRLRSLGFIVVEIEAHQMRSRAGVVAAVVEALTQHGWTGHPATVDQGQKPVS